MNAEIVNIEDLFQEQVSYRIPQFQRPYAWGPERQWEPLWRDVHGVAERFLDKEEMRPHFMGAIVLQLQQSNTGEVTKRLVIDGQQRLTTLQLVIKATEQVFQSQDDTVRAARLSRLTTNQDNYWGGDHTNETKIRQCNSYDQRAFHAVITDHHSSNQSVAISEAYKYFEGVVKDWLLGKSEYKARADALVEAITQYLQIAVIDLDQDEKPHVIFETLNARAAQLTQSDLIKNTIMYEAGVIDDDKKAKELWGMFEHKWWQGETAYASSKEIHIDRFLRYWMIIREQREFPMASVAWYFRRYVERKKEETDDKRTIEIIAEDIRRVARVYQNIEEIHIPKIEIFLKRMKAMKMGVVTPLLLWLFTSEVSEEQRLRSVKALESCLVRYALCGIDSQGLNHIVTLILHMLERPEMLKASKIDYDVAADASAIIVTCLQRFTKWPNDREVCEYLTTQPMRGAVARKKMVLEAVEMYLRGDYAEPILDTAKLTVEHVMPVKWHQHWALPPDKDETEAIDDREQAIKLIGNLTLVTGKLNGRLKNNSWDEKRKTLGNHSSLFLNNQLLSDAPGVWDEAAIEKRSSDLANILIEIFPSAETLLPALVE